MISQQTKERIAKDSITAYMKAESIGSEVFIEGYMAGAEAEATRAEVGIEILKELCQLKKYKDEVGKTSFYEERQPELWKLANEFINNYNKTDK